MMTKYGVDVDKEFVNEYLNRLVNKIFKLLPLREEHNPYIDDYHHSLMLELLGMKSLFADMSDKSEFICVLASLETINSIENIKTYRSKVFECINIIKNIK